MSYREAVDTLNKLFHRSPETSIKLKTYMDFCTRTGNRLESNLNHHASMVLENAGFDPETGLPSKEPPLSKKYKLKKQESSVKNNLCCFGLGSESGKK